jgi:predicted RNA binding protein YcfA (HicA-like mRNA interferase family)
VARSNKDKESVDKLVTELQDYGWQLQEVTAGMFQVYGHPHKPGRLVVPNALGQEFPREFLNSIRRRAGIPEHEKVRRWFIPLPMLPAPKGR